MYAKFQEKIDAELKEKRSAIESADTNENKTEPLSNGVTGGPIENNNNKNNKEYFCFKK